VTITEKTVTRGDGTVERTVTEERKDPRTGAVTRQVIEGGGQVPQKITDAERTTRKK
jgi:hypothetical protein